jgi:hypothetical protein
LRLQLAPGLLGWRRAPRVDARFRVAWAKTDAGRTHNATGKNDQCKKCAIMPIQMLAAIIAQCAELVSSSFTKLVTNLRANYAVSMGDISSQWIEQLEL